MRSYCLNVIVVALALRFSILEGVDLAGIDLASQE